MDKFREILKQIDPDGKIFTEAVLKELFDIVESKKAEAVKTAEDEKEKEKEEKVKELDEKAKKEVEDLKKDSDEKIKKLDEDCTKKLEELAAKYEAVQLDEVAQKVFAYIDSVIVESIPEQTLVDKIRFEQLGESIEKIKGVLVFTEEYAKKEVQEAITEAKTQLDEKVKELDKVMVENVALKTKFEKIEAEKLLESKTKDLADTQKVYLVKLFENATSKEISEKFDEAVKAYEKELETKKQKLLDENKNTGVEITIPKAVDNSVIEESNDEMAMYTRLVEKSINKCK